MLLQFDLISFFSDTDNNNSVKVRGFSDHFVLKN